MLFTGVLDECPRILTSNSNIQLLRTEHPGLDDTPWISHFGSCSSVLAFGNLDRKQMLHSIVGLDRRTLF